MRINCYPDTDSLYIDLSEQPSTETREISEGVNLDYDQQGALVGIEIDNARDRRYEPAWRKGRPSASDHAREPATVAARWIGIRVLEKGT